MDSQNNVAIDSIKVARLAMENAIRAAVAAAMEAFRSDTGLSPQSIQVLLVDVTNLGERDRRYVVSEVRADVSL